jgi:hypothetical protein
VLAFYKGMNSLNEQINFTLINQKGIKAAGRVNSSNENTSNIFGDKKIRKEGGDIQQQK